MLTVIEIDKAGHYHRSRATLTLVKESNSFSRFSAKSSKTSKPPIFTSVKNVDIASSSSHRISTFTSRRNSTGSSEEMEPTSVLKYSATNRHDFQLTKITRSLSSGATTNIGNGSVSGKVGVIDFNVVAPGTPGSPYRSSVMNGSIPTKPNLNKELLHKLRSMTETIKMLSIENETLRGENDELKVKSTKNAAADDSKVPGKHGEMYGDLTRGDLISLTVSYDQKVKALTEEVCTLQKEINQARLLASNESEFGTQTLKSAGEKDKYKALARRLKEERNQYRETCEEKQREQAALKDEMEKMSELISELRENCQKLQLQLLEVRQVSREQKSVGVQVSLLGETNSRPLARKLAPASSTSLTIQESIKKAKSVYGPKQPKPKLPVPARSNQANSSSSSSVISLKDSEDLSKRRPHTTPSLTTTTSASMTTAAAATTRSAATSPAKPSLIAKSSPKPARSGPIIARPVTKPVAAVQSIPSPILMRTSASSPSPSRTASPYKISASSSSSPSRLEYTPQSSSSISSPSRILSPSRIPSPKNRPNRIPSAPRYKPPTRAIEQPPAPSPSPPPPPPPSELYHNIEIESAKLDLRECESVKMAAESPKPNLKTPETKSNEISPMFNKSPPPAPPQSRIEVDEDKIDEDEEEEILTVHPDGQVELHSTSRMSNRSSVVGDKVSVNDCEVTVEEPIVPNMVQNSRRSPICLLSDEEKASKTEQVSADDEGSRDGEDSQGPIL